ncbi:unnamed protein product [Phaedon cochleariae]|uniref:Uncharacterized protein n=1 Tax=Phaedon cochleariae TaxID=80249 RepID=A0A9P0D9C4_PHACE|nr:unnamed protein product [Phaedon cochleariae]
MDSAFLQQIYLLMFLAESRFRGREMYMPEMIIDMSTLLKDPSTQGSIIFRNFTFLIEPNSIQYNENDVVVTPNTDEEGIEKFDVCLKLTIESLNFTTIYVADIALGEHIPIYGEGNMAIHLSNIVMDLCTIANTQEAYAENMNLRMSYQRGQTSITGIYLHPDADRIGSQLLEIGSSLFEMWNKYEPEKASCVLSPVMQYILNQFLYYEHNSLEFNTTCLQESIVGNIWRNSRGLYQEIQDILQSRSASTITTKETDSSTTVNGFQSILKLIFN